MQKKVIVEKMRVQSERLKHLMAEFSATDNHSVAEIDQALKETEQLARVLSAYRFLAEHKEISNDINVHMKIMDVVSKQEEARLNDNVGQTKAEITEVLKPVETVVKEEPIIEKKIEKIEERPEPVVISKPVQKEVEPVINPTSKQEPLEPSKNGIFLKKIEFGINDKYRVINELFNQNQSEYNTAINQLNMTGSWEDAEDYLDSLKSLYSWKSDLPLVKTFYSISQKRFQ